MHRAQMTTTPPKRRADRMADNVAVTPGSGATIAADEIAGVLHQRVKVSVGADGAAADLAFGQAVAAAETETTRVALLTL
jgi:hypothetical protein